MIPGLDGLRAIAFLLVYFFHVNFLLIGWVGVQLFFVLSGYLITGILMRMKEDFSLREYLGKFYGRRFLRIFPLYYFYLLAMAGLVWVLLQWQVYPGRMQEYLNQLPFALAYVYNFFYASALFKDSFFVSHFWSLSTEEQFYIFWPLLIFFVPKKYYGRLFIGAILLAPMIRLGLSVLYNRYWFDWLSTDVGASIYVLPFSSIDAFALGALISLWKIPHARQQLAILAFIIPVIGYGSQYLTSGVVEYPTALGFVFPLANGLKQVWGYSLLNYFFAVLISAVVHDGLFVRFLEQPWLAFLGRISYGLYVYHYAVIFFFMRMQDVFPLTYDQALWLALFCALPVTILLAYLSYRFLEKPLLDLKDRFFAVQR